jgi:type II pantothenate kinase
MIIGIDIGSTTTKAVVLQSTKILYKIKTKASDAVTSATGILGKLTLENELDIRDIEKIIITGAGSSRIKKDIFNISTEKIDEITAIGHGGMLLSGKDKVIIANIGTGTAIIEATRDRISHLGGTGIGGGTIIGLGKGLINTSGFADIMGLAVNGDLRQVDLLIEDIVEANIGFLKGDATASNFGKMKESAAKEDIAMGIINLVYQAIGMVSVFAAKSKNMDMVLVTGNGSNNILGRKVLEQISVMYNMGFVFPDDAEFATAIGAALAITV